MTRRGAGFAVDEVVVKVVEIDQQGRINLSRKDALADIEARQKRNEQ